MRPLRTALSEHNEVSQGKLRRLNLVLQVPPIILTGVVLVLIDHTTWWGTAALVVGVVAAVVAMERWTADDLARVALPCLVITAAVWVFGALVTDSSTAFYGLGVVGSLVVPQLPRHRIAAGLGLLAFIAAVGASRLLVSQDDVVGDLIVYVLVPTGVFVVATPLLYGNQRYLDLMKETRDREAELAVAQERIRFAGDLHDIQGHTLHVVKLKTVLAQKLVHSDADRAQEELREIHALVADTIAQTKNLAHAQRRLNLSAELENAKNLFEAAGIAVRVDRRAEADPRTAELLGQVLRETTTNILRHAQATLVRITLTGQGIDIVNDGAKDAPLPALSGLSALRQRVTEDGGELTVEQESGRFRTAAAFPRAGATPAPATKALEGSR
ncbi:sensor histidine kinase [Promicromonospora sukumoe]|uniref:Two-component system sensor histidine kinase DesK n=1 Tax=Promicromonospora sukumoe TaxID=88382 RepID=A0A7W3J8L8_9MICO|nr:histidine kinase [Promicromonospora sukumoe]MBA8808268.1 two-component system sensor histidine kinase DesK [Promicromonospora sukumoe]